jgi:hypothetical protein
LVACFAYYLSPCRCVGVRETHSGIMLSVRLFPP